MNIKLLNDAEYQIRFSQIDFLQSIGRDNSIKVKYSEEILNQFGKQFDVFPPPKKSNKMKIGSCYRNALNKLEAGYQYVEGIITHKKSRIKISHAWNIDRDGRHFDFTILETHEYNYKGIILPEDVLTMVGFKNGGIRYCSLPYLEILV